MYEIIELSYAEKRLQLCDIRTEKIKNKNENISTASDNEKI